MPWLPGNCPNCGGILQIDSSKDAAICEFCGTPFVTEKAINIYNNATIHAQNIVINNNVDTSKSDYEIIAGVLKQYKGASPVAHIPEGVITIERNCFGGTPNGRGAASTITEVYIPTTVQNANFAFVGCKSLYKAVIAEGASTVSAYLFKGCMNLREVNIPNSVKEIQSGAFSETGITSVNISQNCLVHALAFGKCSSLSNVNISYPIIVEGMTGAGGSQVQEMMRDESALKEYFAKYRKSQYFTPFADTPFMTNLIGDVPKQSIFGKLSSTLRGNNN